ncbi:MULTISPECIES: hypothetical protein [Thiorhodovibrio]|nr:MULTISPECIES: hypothetical protein [Thiorhodovibrio]
MKQLLLDVNIVVDLCVERAGSINARLALAPETLIEQQRNEHHA